MRDRIVIVIPWSCTQEPPANERVEGFNTVKLFLDFSRTYGILSLYLYIINKRNMKLPFEMKFIMQLLLAAICIVLFMVVIPVVASLYIGNLYILYPVMFLYGCAIALIFNPVK